MSEKTVPYVKKHEFLLCIDSDGCAVDTMEIKHRRCFGPCMVKTWHLEAFEAPILERWNEINLYSLTRGINRFRGLGMALMEIHERYTPIEGVRALEKWAETAPELSNAALKAYISEGEKDPIFEKALSWSEAVNHAIRELPEAEKKAFPLVREALEKLKPFCDIAIVSAANRDAVEEEWNRLGLMPFVDITLCQDTGSKAEGIQFMLEKGFDPKKILMTGDAPGDLSAAQKNGVYFYPILVGHEKESWSEYPEAVERLMSGTYEALGKELEKRFYENLTSK